MEDNNRKGPGVFYAVVGVATLGVAIIGATFAFFSKGIDKFNEYYKQGYFEKVYSTNLVYVPEEIKKQPWFSIVDCSPNVAYVINELNYGRSIGEVIKGRDAVLTKVRTVRKERGLKWKEWIERVLP